MAESVDFKDDLGADELEKARSWLAASPRESAD